MRINSISDTNFKMSLKINPKLQPEIAKKGQELVVELEKYGEKIAGIKNYDVVFDESLYPKVKNANKLIGTDYFAMLKREELNLGKYYEVPSGVPGDTVSGFYPNEPLIFRKVYGEKAKEKYNEFKKLSILDQAAEYSKLLEKLDLDTMTRQETEDAKRLAGLLRDKTEQEKLNSRIEQLINKYKLEKTETPEQPVKKSFWKNLFN